MGTCYNSNEAARPTGSQKIRAAKPAKQAGKDSLKVQACNFNGLRQGNRDKRDAGEQGVCVGQRAQVTTGARGGAK